MYSKFKNNSFANRIVDKFERRNRGNIFLLLRNYYIYLQSKIIRTKLVKSEKSRNHILSQIKENALVAEIGVWRGDFSKKNPTFLQKNNVGFVLNKNPQRSFLETTLGFFEKNPTCNAGSKIHS